jgi:hypothetical protein
MKLHDPLPPLRTGRADFPHPALATALVQGHARRAGTRRLAQGPATASQRTRSGLVGRPLWDATRPSGCSLLLPRHAALRPLRSTGVTPLPHYYEPVRLPAAAARRVMSSPVALGAAAHHAGSPRFLDRSMCARRPHSPRKVRWVLVPVASPSVAGFTISGRLATFTWCNEAVSGSLALRLTQSLPGASPRGLLHTTSGSLPVERAIDRVTSFHVTRSVRLVLAHRIARIRGAPSGPKFCSVESMQSVKSVVSLLFDWAAGVRSRSRRRNSAPTRASGEQRSPWRPEDRRYCSWPRTEPEAPSTRVRVCRRAIRSPSQSSGWRRMPLSRPLTGARISAWRSPPNAS